MACFEIHCHKSPFQQFGNHGLEGYHRGQKYRATKVYDVDGTVRCIALYTEFIRGHWHIADVVSQATFKRFFNEVKR